MSRLEEDPPPPRSDLGSPRLSNLQSTHVEKSIEEQEWFKDTLSAKSV